MKAIHLSIFVRVKDLRHFVHGDKRLYKSLYWRITRHACDIDRSKSLWYTFIVMWPSHIPRELHLFVKNTKFIEEANGASALAKANINKELFCVSGGIVSNPRGDITRVSVWSEGCDSSRTVGMVCFGISKFWRGRVKSLGRHVWRPRGPDVSLACSPDLNSS